MILRNPSDLIFYLRALATQHPLVACVIHGEMSRPEAGTTTTNTYPLVLIEWPSVKKPRSSGPLRMMTRMYFLSTAPDAQYADEDNTSSVTYQIAYNILGILQAHSDDSDYPFSLSAEEMTIDPVEYMGSDQMRGWMIPLEVEIDQSLCIDNPMDPADVSIPQFTWGNKSSDPHNPELNFEDISTHGTSYASSTWYYSEAIDQPIATTFEVDDGITPSNIADLDEPRIVHVWLKLTLSSGLVLWAYARIDGAEASGRSIPFFNIYPI